MDRLYRAIPERYVPGEFTDMNVQAIKNSQVINEAEIIAGGVIWFAVLLSGFTPLTLIGGFLYLGFLASKMYL
jgi:hypothetical protein